MASPCEVHVAAADREVAARVLDVVADEALRVEAKFSRYRPDNVVHAINTADGRTVAVDEETAQLIDYAAQLHALSEGRFDLTSGVLRKVWRFDGSDRVPTRSAVREVLRKVGWLRARWRAPELTLEPGMQIDFGGIGKEYAVDRAAALAASLCGSCLINFGGDLLAVGPSLRGRPWRVGIEALGNPGAAAKELDLPRGGVATSGDARRFLLRNGRRYGHVLDARTGWPVEGAPRSVTVTAPTCTEAGTLATLALLHGAHAEGFLEAQNARYWCLR
jgi:thiamine biosynthesis lipoprotein